MGTGIPPATDSSPRFTPAAPASKAAGVSWRLWLFRYRNLAGRRRRPYSVSPNSADFGRELPDDVTHVRRQLGVLGGYLALQSPERHGQLDPLDHRGTRNSERLAGLVVRPYPAVLAEGAADHGQRLAFQ